MSKYWTLSLIGASVACLGLAWGQDSRNPSEARIPEFIRKALASPSVLKAGLFVSKDGAITRYAVHLGKEGVPDWIHAMADEKIGKGEDIAYEAELYPDGSEVYEIYRRVGGKEKQLSVAHRDRSLKYVGTQMAEKDLPDKVQATLKGIQGLVIEKCIFKEGPRFAEVHVRGLINGFQHRVRIGGDGRLLSIQRRIPADFEVVQE